MFINVKKAKVNSDIEVPQEAICLPDHDTKISELAYFKAENRGFALGHELEDWLEAEGEFLL